MENELAVRNVGDLATLGSQFEKSGLFGCSQEGQGLVLAMTCIQQKISPIEFSQTYHIIDGKLSMKADAMLAKFVARGGRYTIIERSATRAAAVFATEDNQLEAEYTLEDAKKSGICFKKDGKMKDNWAAHTKQMLWARLTSDSVRAIDPGVNFGMYAPEEIGDFDAAVPAAAQVGGKRKSESAPDPMKRAEAAPAAKAEPPPAPEVAEPEVLKDDAGLMPVGPNKGKPWSDFSDAQLSAALKCGHPAITPSHLAAIQAVLDLRKAG